MPQRTGLTLVVATALVCLCVSCTAPRVEDGPNMNCVARLQLPAYPPIAQSARMTGSLTAVTAIGKEGVIQSVTFEDISGPRPDLNKTFISPVIERALRASRFEATCAGKTVRLVFSFRMDRNPPNGVWFESPNRFEIGAEATLINTNSLKP